MELIKRVTKPGDTVLDPFLGTGTTGVAAVGLKRKFIGSEIDNTRFLVAKKRIAEAINSSFIAKALVP